MLPPHCVIVAGPLMPQPHSVVVAATSLPPLTTLRHMIIFHYNTPLCRHRTATSRSSRRRRAVDAAAAPRRRAVTAKYFRSKKVKFLPSFPPFSKSLIMFQPELKNRFIKMTSQCLIMFQV